MLAKKRELSGRVNVGTKEKPVWVQEGLSATDVANAKNQAREDEIRNLIDDIIGVYEPGGSFGKGTEAMLERQKTKDVASGTQQLISSGLYGSTMTAGLPKKWEEEIGMPQRAKLEDIRMQAYTGALGQKAGFIERIEDQSPSFELMAGLTQQGASAPQQSLSDWLSANFGGGMSTGPSKADISKAQTRQENLAWEEQQRKNLANIRARYGSVGVA